MRKIIYLVLMMVLSFYLCVYSQDKTDTAVDKDTDKKEEVNKDAPVSKPANISPVAPNIPAPTKPHKVSPHPIRPAPKPAGPSAQPPQPAPQPKPVSSDPGPRPPVPAPKPAPKPVQPDVSSKDDKDKKINADEVIKKDGTILMDFAEEDLKNIIPIMSLITKDRYLFEEKDVRGKKITLMAPEPVSVGQAREIFKAILNTFALALVPSTEAGVVKIVSAKDAAKGELEDKGTGENMIYQVINLKYLEVKDVKPLLAQPFVSGNGAVYEYGPSNSFLLVETAAKIKWLMNLIEQLDVEKAVSRKIMEIIAIKYARVKNIESLISQLIKDMQPSYSISSPPGPPGRPSAPVPKPGTPGKSDVRIMSDERTNSLIILATEAEIKEIKDIIAKLDVKVDTVTGEIFVYSLQYANATELATTLSTIASRSKSFSGGSVPPGPGAPSSAQMSIIAEKNTNSLIIAASQEDYDILEQTIKKLDVMPPQVLVETIIGELSMDKTKTLGVELATLDSPKEGSVTGFGGTNFSNAILNVAKGGTAGMSGMVFGVMKGTTADGIPKIGAIIDAYAANSDFNLLANPAVVTSDNQEANIDIKDRIPYVKDYRVDSNNNVNKTWDYIEVGIGLKVTPQINYKRETNERSVKLKISNEISKMISGGTTASDNPSTAKRTVTTSLCVNDKETVVIGGLMRDDESKAVTKVPGLGDIPIIKYLFRRHKTVKYKTNLLIFITPTILTTKEEMVAASKKIKTETDKFKAGEDVIGKKIPSETPPAEEGKKKRGKKK